MTLRQTSGGFDLVLCCGDCQKRRRERECQPHSSCSFEWLRDKVNKSIGEQVQPGEAIVEISNLDTVWVEAPIFERDLESARRKCFSDLYYSRLSRSGI